jgi:carbon-monoxide dehydrogenase medium subunit
VKPAPFVYIAAESTEDAVAALAEHADEAKILAGGQSLVPVMNLRLARPAVLVDINPVRELAGIRVNGAIEIGAVTRQIAVERSPEIQEHAPLVAEALRHVSYPAVRARGTIGGSLAHADPAAELPAVLVALDGEVVVRGPAGERTIRSEQLIAGVFTTSLSPDEVLTTVRFPVRAPDDRFGFQEVARKSGDFALVGVAAAVRGDGSARVVVFGVGDRPIRLPRVEETIGGRTLDAAVLDEAERVACDEVDPNSDAHASSRARRELTGVLVRRALAQAAAVSR